MNPSRSMQPCTVDGCDRDVEDTTYVCSPCGDRLIGLLAALGDTREPDPMVLTYPHKPHHEHCDDCDLPLEDRRTAGHPDLNPLRRTGPTRIRPGLLTDAEDRIAHGQTVHVGERDGMTTDAGPVTLPYRYSPSEARWELLNTLTAAADDIARRRGLHRPYNTPQALAAWLTGNVPWIRAQPDGGNLIAELLDAIDTMKRAIDVPATMRYAGPCNADIDVTTETVVAGVPTTTLTTRPCYGELYARPGAIDVTCPDCGATYPVTARRAWLLDQVTDVLLPAAEMAVAVNGLLDTDVKAARLATNIRWWKSVGRLPEKGRTRDGRPKYRVGDVVDLVVQSAKRRTPHSETA
ncbi:hypothetical protein Xcel_0547 [Xylanimonas cellulosilytica DSM 15894]|uniref:Helix-turn-helix DNA binding domain protein n=1 Tax=Xylanimonas cellulosilytica (strain DSM 15894 / JCM 12276 / CECT 5975 / KCTC 9989 / LMG 20990 / NBRC 107835 / XIL07) TaxID=446471 RepID=D1BW83_XYLCX|nr:hypothetical protein [Xylanimonas cellulosilytica]ACZ29586.1 hypothetical protein Xcel_0547 [Xylanimonas cellulosilytica DSM 15894]